MVRTLLAQAVDGRAEVTVAGAAVLLGIPLEELAARCGPITTLDGMPKEFRQLAQRRTREGQAAAGAAEVGPVLMYWAAVLLGDDVDFDYDDHTKQLWMIHSVIAGRPSKTPKDKPPVEESA
jgi:hypothetical protein